MGRIDPVDSWKYRWLYIGVYLGYSGLVSGEDFNIKHMPAIGLYTIFQPIDFFGITIDAGMYRGGFITISPTLIFRPLLFEINLFMGGGFNPMFGTPTFVAGARGGYHIGPGLIYIEARTISYFPIEIYVNNVIRINVSLGYQIGVISRKK